MNLHPNFGALLASYYGLTAELRIRTQHHHERWDGRGYPHCLGGEDIPLMARVVQVADTFDAMVDQREYNTPRTLEEAVAELRRESRRQFDPRVVEAFLDTLPKGERTREQLDEAPHRTLTRPLREGRDKHKTGQRRGGGKAAQGERPRYA